MIELAAVVEEVLVAVDEHVIVVVGDVVAVPPSRVPED